ncbi:hypothetical protein ACFLTU_09360 [Bacteroidota bacterium]
MKKTKRQKWIELFQDLNLLMEDNIEKWSSIEYIRLCYDEFISNLKKLKDLQPELEKDISAVKMELAENRKILVQKIFPLANILEVYAEDQQLGKKASALILDQKRLEKTSHKNLFNYANRIYRQIDKYVHRTEIEDDSPVQVSPGQDIERYGLTPSMMDELNSAIHQFQSAMKLRKDVLSYREKTQKKSDDLIRCNRKLLKSRLNKLMTVFSGTHPSFYQEYVSVIRK